MQRDRRGTAAGARTPRDVVLILRWPDQRSPHTRRAYEADARSLLANAGKPLADMTIADLHLWVDSLAQLASASRARKIRAVKSLFSFGKRRGLLSADLGVVLRAPSIRRDPGERTLSHADVMRLIALEPNRRNRAMLRLGYLGFRTSSCRPSLVHRLAPRAALRTHGTCPSLKNAFPPGRN